MAGAYSGELPLGESPWSEDRIDKGGSFHDSPPRYVVMELRGVSRNKRDTPATPIHPSPPAAKRPLSTATQNKDHLEDDSHQTSGRNGQRLEPPALPREARNQHADHGREHQDSRLRVQRSLEPVDQRD